jgi:hypothetical protein
VPAPRHRANARLRDLFADERQDVFGLWVASNHRLREEQFTVEVDVEDASRSRNDLDSLDQLLPLLENARNQTGRVGQCASGDAVLNPEMMLRSHRTIVVSVALPSAESSAIGRWMVLPGDLRRDARGSHDMLTTGDSSPFT